MASLAMLVSAVLVLSFGLTKRQTESHTETQTDAGDRYTVGVSNDDSEHINYSIHRTVRSVYTVIYSTALSKLLKHYLCHTKTIAY